MSDLPTPRVTISKPFTHCGLDYAGPISVKLGKGRGYQSQKGYIVLFVCLATRAIQLELVSNNTTQSFLGALNRFVSRRGLPSDFYSDNGKNFEVADKELQRSFKKLCRDPTLEGYLSQNEIVWHFIPPYAPHFGGLWETGVKSVKHNFRRIVGGSTFTLEELMTILSQIEACFNSRPIAPFTDNPDDFSYLTPGHLLIGRSLLSVPSPTVLSLNENKLTRWQLVQRVTEQLWKRWSIEYLQGLQKRNKWTKTNLNISLNDMLIVKNANLPKCEWDLGRVLKTHPGKDGLVRVVSVKTSKGVYQRPITQLCQLQINKDFNN